MRGALNGLLLNFHKFSTGAESEETLTANLDKALAANKYVPDLICAPAADLPEPPQYVG